MHQIPRTCLAGCEFQETIREHFALSKKQRLPPNSLAERIINIDIDDVG